MAMQSHKKFAYSFFSIAAALTLFGVIYFKLHYTWTNDALIDGYAVESSANVTEKVMDLFAEEGDEVKKGQLLAVLRNNVPLAQKE